MATRETLSLTVQQMQSLRRILAQYLPDEKRHYEESGEPFDHVYQDLVAVRWAIRQHDQQVAQDERDLTAMNELAVRLSQG